MSPLGSKSWGLSKLQIVILIFFVALAFSPGLLLTLPPNNIINEDTKINSDIFNHIFVSSETNIYASIVHAFVIAFVVFLMLSINKISDILVR